MWLKSVQGLAVDFLMGGTDACPLVDGVDSYPLVGGALSLSEIRGDCVPGGLYVACLLIGRAVIPPGLFFGLGLLSADGWGQIFPKWLYIVK